jgi:hypothetical protein
MEITEYGMPALRSMQLSGGEGIILKGIGHGSQYSHPFKKISTRLTNETNLSKAGLNAGNGKFIKHTKAIVITWQQLS